MKKSVAYTLAVFFLSINLLAAQNATISINSIGFKPQAVKKASVAGEANEFVIKRADDKSIVFEGKLSAPVFQKDVNQNVSLADFSSLNKVGKYFIELPDGSKSALFEISKTAYDQAFYTSMRAFYLWRCGTAVAGDYSGKKYSHEACHLNDGYEDFQGKPDVKRDGTGGWHDAGDYGKYVVNAGITVGMMFLAWENFQDKLKNFKLDLPETATGYPDYLKELKWETDWLFTMQYTDGSGKVSHKLTRKSFEPFCKPEDDKEKRYFTDWSSAATADFVGMMAQAARYFMPYDKVYAQKCLNAAKISYNFLKANPEDKVFVQGEFVTGGYQTEDKDDRLWAAAEMWETTGDREYLADFEKRATEQNGEIDEDWDWQDVSNLGMFTYALSKKQGKNPELDKQIKKNIVNVANLIAFKCESDVYGRPSTKYYWGCNGTMAREVINLQVANKIAPNKNYMQAAQGVIGHLFGRNFYNRSYVTGLGINPPMNPHDRRSASDSVKEPWPGYLVGGGHTATGWNDQTEDYRTNEIAINWQGALVYALAGFIEE
ncbi:MAG TPA: glycoside hydrolase family 9 protein [Prolixibacteraceae bacterium]|nr:glycoside hydrolase family 9 protein [Prolixibacteraceae bacterium]